MHIICIYLEYMSCFVFGLSLCSFIILSMWCCSLVLSVCCRHAVQVEIHDYKAVKQADYTQWEQVSSHKEPQDKHLYVICQHSTITVGLWKRIWWDILSKNEVIKGHMTPNFRPSFLCILRKLYFQRKIPESWNFSDFFFFLGGGGLISLLTIPALTTLVRGGVNSLTMVYFVISFAKRFPVP